MKKKAIKLSIIGIIIITFTIIIQDDNNTTYAAGTTLAQTVIDKNPTGISTWESGASGVYKTTYGDRANDYRYIGANVDNYVKFNNDMYQIIGVFDENTHGITGQQLVKLIRARILYSSSWGVYNTASKDGKYSSYSSNWTGKYQTSPANINVLLNEYFYNKTNTSDTYGSCSNWTYYGSGNSKKTEDCSTLVGYGIDEGLRDYIETTTWHLNGYKDYTIEREKFYLCERKKYSGCGPAKSSDTTTNAKIGLMYVTDFMYASGYLGSSDPTQGYSINYQNQNWLYKGKEYTITPKYDNDTKVFSINKSGSFIADNSVFSLGVRPTFYLKQDVYVTGGDGSFDNPYTVACDTCSNA